MGENILRVTEEGPKIAVLLAAFNGVRWLGEQLDSIFFQDSVSITIFISVDISSDGTEEWVDQRAKTDGRIIVLPHGRRFGGAAQNFFRLLSEIDFSNFDYISFADQDDVWLPNKLLRAHEILMDTGADAYSSNVIAFWPNGRKKLINKAQKQVRWDFLFEAAGPGCTYVIRKKLACAFKVLLKANPDDVLRLGLHDWLTYAYARANGYKWIIDDYPGMYYRQHADNQVGVNQGWKAFTYRAVRVLSGWGLGQSALIARLIGLKENSFVVSWTQGGRSGLFRLAMHGWTCRRKPGDRLIFSLSCLMLCVWGPGANE